MERSKEVEGGGEQLVLPHRREEHTEEPPPLHRDGAGKPPSLTKGGSDQSFPSSAISGCANRNWVFARSVRDLASRATPAMAARPGLMTPKLLCKYVPPAWAPSYLSPPRTYLPFLANVPTPISKWELPPSLVPEGFNVYIKRDDVTGIELSGNKVRDRRDGGNGYNWWWSRCAAE